jgi:hypothetical protein
MPSPGERHRVPQFSVNIETPADIGLEDLLSMTPEELEDHDDIEITVDVPEDH